MGESRHRGESVAEKFVTAVGNKASNVLPPNYIPILLTPVTPTYACGCPGGRLGGAGLQRTRNHGDVRGTEAAIGNRVLGLGRRCKGGAMGVWVRGEVVGETQRCGRKAGRGTWNR